MEVRGYEARNFLKEKLEILGNEIAQELSKYNKRSLVNYHFGNLEYGLIDICFSEGKTPKEILETIFSSKETLATLKGYAQKKSEHLPEVVDDNLKISYDILLTLILRHAKDKGGKEFDARNSTLYSNVQKYLYWISELYSFDPLNQEKFVVKVGDGNEIKIKNIEKPDVIKFYEEASKDELKLRKNLSVDKLEYQPLSKVLEKKFGILLEDADKVIKAVYRLHRERISWYEGKRISESEKDELLSLYLGYLSRPKHDFVKKIRKITGFDSDKTKNILSLLVEDGSSLENIKDEPRILWRKPILETKDHYHVNVYSLLSPFLFYQSMANEIFEEESYKHEFFRDVGRFFESEFDNVMKGKVDVLIPKSEIHKPGVSKFRDLEELFNKIYEIRKKVGIDAPITKTDLADRFILDGNTLWACEIKAHFPSNLSKDENLIKRIVEYRAYCEEMLIKSEFILQHPDFVAGEIIGENIDILKCEVKPLIISRYYEPARMPEYKAKASLVEAGVESWQRPWNLVECLERWLEIEAKHASIRKINSTPIISFADVVSGDYKKELLKY